MNVLILIAIISFLGGVIFMLYWFLETLKTKKKSTWLGQLLCRHDYRLDNPDEVFPVPVDGTWVSYSRWHTCTKCGKKELIGSGMIG